MMKRHFLASMAAGALLLTACATPTAAPTSTPATGAAKATTPASTPATVAGTPTAGTTGASATATPAAMGTAAAASTAIAPTVQAAAPTAAAAAGTAAPTVQAALPTAQAAATQAAPTAQAAATAAATAVAGSPVTITDVAMLPSGPAIEIENTGNQRVDLSDWSLRVGSAVAVMPEAAAVAPGEQVTIHLAEGTTTQSDIYLGQDAATLVTGIQPGTVVALLDAQRNEVASFRLPG